MNQLQGSERLIYGCLCVVETGMSWEQSWKQLFHTTRLYHTQSRKTNKVLVSQAPVSSFMFI